MYETLVGMLFAAGSVGSYLLAARVVNRGRAALGHLPQRLLRAGCGRHARGGVARTTAELSRHFGEK